MDTIKSDSPKPPAEKERTEESICHPTGSTPAVRMSTRSIQTRRPGRPRPEGAECTAYIGFLQDSPVIGQEWRVKLLAAPGPGTCRRPRCPGGVVYPGNTQAETAAVADLRIEPHTVPIERPSADGAVSRPAAAPRPDPDRMPDKADADAASRQDEAADKTSSGRPAALKPLSDAEVLAQTAQKWKYKAVPPLAPEPAPEIRSAEEKYSCSRIVGARVRGKKHKHEGTNCDDWFATAAVGDVTLAAVADGAGSRPFSRIGARVSCEAAIQFLEQEFSRLQRSELQHEAIMAALKGPMDSDAFGTAAGMLCTFVQQAVARAVRAVEEAFAERRDNRDFSVPGRDLQLGDFACTLLVTVAVPAGEDEYLLISCQVGDGAIVSLDTEGQFPQKARLLSEADSGEFSGQTEFITSDRFKQLPVLQSRTRVHRGRSRLVMLMTDGVADDYHPNDTQIVQLYYDLIANGILEAPAGKGQELPDMELPEPAAYPWVNNQDVLIPFNYTDRIMEATGLSLADLWEHREVLSRADAKLPKPRPQSASERLATWLDNYVQRGSFDDRTLVLMLLDGGDQ